MSESRIYTWLQRLTFWVVVPLLFAGALVVGASSFRVAVPTEERQYCLQAAKETGNKYPYCPTDETVWKRGLSDPVAYYTLWLTLFTGVLATVGIGQGYLIRQQVQLARDEFNATHRPKVIVRNFHIGIHKIDKLPDGAAINPVFTGQNIGDSKARVIEVRSGITLLKKGEKPPSGLSFPGKESFDFELATGARDLFPANTGFVPDSEFFFNFFSDEYDLYCLGTLTYIDSSGTQRETGFCRRYIEAADSWETIESEYEYAY